MRPETFFKEALLKIALLRVADQMSDEDRDALSRGADQMPDHIKDAFRHRANQIPEKYRPFFGPKMGR